MNFDKLVLSGLALSSRLFTFTTGRGLTLTSAHVLVPITYRWARLATHRHWGPHFVAIPCSCAHFGHITAAYVSSPERRGSLHRLAHVAGHGHFSGASTSGRSVPFVGHRSRQKATIQKHGDNFPLRHRLSLMSVPTRVFRPAGRHMHRTTHTHGITGEIDSAGISAAA